MKAASEKGRLRKRLKKWKPAEAIPIGMVPAGFKISCA